MSTGFRLAPAGARALVYHQLPDWLGAALAELAKGEGHKYIARIPSQRPGRKWEYIYHAASGKGVAHLEHFQVGAKFAFQDGEQKGHFHIEAIEGDTVHVVHDETGKKAKLSKQALASLLHEHHIEAIEARGQRIERDITAAKANQATDKQLARLRAERQAHQAKFAHVAGGGVSAADFADMVGKLKGSKRKATRQLGEAFGKAGAEAVAERIRAGKMGPGTVTGQLFATAVGETAEAWLERRSSELPGMPEGAMVGGDARKTAPGSVQTKPASGGKQGAFNFGTGEAPAQGPADSPERKRTAPDQITADEQLQREEAARASAARRRKADEAPAPKIPGDSDLQAHHLRALPDGAKVRDRQGVTYTRKGDAWEAEDGGAASHDRLAMMADNGNPVRLTPETRRQLGDRVADKLAQGELPDRPALSPRVLEWANGLRDIALDQPSSRKGQAVRWALEELADYYSGKTNQKPTPGKRWGMVPDASHPDGARPQLLDHLDPEGHKRAMKDAIRLATKKLGAPQSHPTADEKQAHSAARERVGDEDARLRRIASGAALPPDVEPLRMTPEETEAVRDVTRRDKPRSDYEGDIKVASAMAASASAAREREKKRAAPDQITQDEQRQREEAARRSADKRRRLDQEVVQAGLKRWQDEHDARAKAAEEEVWARARGENLKQRIERDARAEELKERFEAKKREIAARKKAEEEDYQRAMERYRRREEAARSSSETPPSASEPTRDAPPLVLTPPASHDDVGSHVAFARKDLDNLSFAQIRNLPPDEAAKVVKKAKLAPKWKADQWKDRGATPGAYEAARAVMRAVSPIPLRFDDPDLTSGYARAIDFVAKSLESCRTADDVEVFLQEWRAKMGKLQHVGTFGTEQEAQRALDGSMANWKGQRWSIPGTVIYNPTVDAWSVWGPIDEATAAAQETVPVRGRFGTTNVNPYQFHAVVLGEKFIKFIVGRGTELRRKGDKMTYVRRPGFFINAVGGEKRWAASGDPWEAWQAEQGKPEGSGAPKTKWAKHVASEPERAGGASVERADAKALASEFGLHNVQFGNYVSQADRDHHLKWAHTAFRDLAEVLGLPTQLVSLQGLNGRADKAPLSLGIGARGQGNAKAHYEPWSKDATTGRKAPIINLTRFAGGGSLAHEWAHFLDNTIAEAHTRPSSDPRATLKRVAGRYVSDGDGLRALAPELRQAYSGVIEAIRGSQYASDARALGSYWARPHEMFARAFESYVEDKLAAAGRKNTYLVDGTGGKYATGRRKVDRVRARVDPQPYPQDEARVAIHGAFDRLFDVLRGGRHLEKALVRLGMRLRKAVRLGALPEPTRAQIEAGNYKKHHVRFAGLPITIENPAGAVRRGVGADGKAWESRMSHDYGYVKGSLGTDGDHIDVFLGPDETAPNAYIIEQLDPDSGQFDEHKVMLGFESADAARKAYRANYDRPARFLGDVHEVPMRQFKALVRLSRTAPGAVRVVAGRLREARGRAGRSG